MKFLLKEIKNHFKLSKFEKKILKIRKLFVNIINMR